MTGIRQKLEFYQLSSPGTTVFFGKCRQLPRASGL